jgi:phytoene dehydrogenase-like protein
MHYDALIIGAGMSGLAAGIRLAYFDHKVCIVEKHYQVGGLNSFYSLAGHKLDVGLHAMTNYVGKGVKSAPLPKLLRQLRLKFEDFDLSQQKSSAIRFPGISLKFTNDFDYFVREVHENFPSQTENFQKLIKAVFAYDELSLDIQPISARRVVSSFISDPLLIDMIFCPLMFYGSAQENDMDFGQFVIMFKSIFCEGFARPQEGVRQILKVLLQKYRECGGELRTRCGVKELRTENGKVKSVLLDGGEVLTADKIISSAGYLETMQLLTDFDFSQAKAGAGKMSFIEFIMILNKEPAQMGYETTITFYNNTDKFSYQKPDGLVDVSSGVICCPNNFQYENALPEGIIRITNMANFDLWNKLDEDEYKSQKAGYLEAALENVARMVPDFRDSVVFTDVFTPKTIYRYTGHLNGAPYGSPDKLRDGRTHLDNLFICGTDQGFLGIIGAMLSGISMANLHGLMGKRADR